MKGMVREKKRAMSELVMRVGRVLRHVRNVSARRFNGDGEQHGSHSDEVDGPLAQAFLSYLCDGCQVPSRWSRDRRIGPL